ncbi:MAG: hypothetical protein ABW005_12705 [Burkholderiaceae bacterium]
MDDDFCDAQRSAPADGIVKKSIESRSLTARSCVGSAALAALSHGGVAMRAGFLPGLPALA